MASSSKKKKLHRMEMQDAQGISRKKWKHTMPPNLFIAIKLVLIILIPIVYFAYSPLLIFVFMAYVSLFFMARLAERSLNKSVIRSNHIHISKFDSGVALIIVLIALFGGLLSTTKKNQSSKFEGMPETEFSQFRGNMDFDEIKKQATLSQIKSSLKSIGSLLTGERNIFAEEQQFNFTPAKPPEDFISDKSEIPEMPEDFDFDFENMGDFPFGGRGMDFKFSMDNIPLNYVGSSTLSTINTILIFSVAGLGLCSLLSIYLKKRKFEREMNEVIVEGKIKMLDISELERILSFGEEVENTDKENDNEEDETTKHTRKQRKPRAWVF